MKLTIKTVIENLDKIRINNAPSYIQGVKGLKEFIDSQNCPIKLSTLSHHKKQLYKQSLKNYQNAYSRGGITGIETIYCKEFIEDCLKLSLSLQLGLRTFEESILNRTLWYTCK